MVFGILLGFFFLALPIIAIIVFLLLIGGIKIIMEYERGILFTLGRFSRIMNPGLNYVIPIIQSWQRVDMRIVTVDIPGQEVMTKDNIPVKIDAVIYFRVDEPKKAILNITDYMFGVSKYGQTSMRDVVGEIELDELLTKREQIAEKLKMIIDRATDDWGVDVTDLKLQNVELPADLKRVMARQAEAEREKRATITMSTGEVVASTNLAKAAKTLATAPGALHLRTLQTIADVSPDPSNTIIYVLPIEILKAIERVGKK